jgi:hypothetical protein
MSRLQANLLLLTLIADLGLGLRRPGARHGTGGAAAVHRRALLIGALVVAPLAWRSGGGWREQRPLTRVDGGHIAALGGLMTLGAVLQQVGMSTPGHRAGFLTALYVPLVPVLGWLLLRQRARLARCGRRRPAAWPAPSCCRARTSCAWRWATCG